MILDQYGQPFRNSLENPRYSLDDPAVYEMLTGGAETVSGARVSPRTAIGYPPFWRGLNLISGDVAKIPLVVYRREADNGKESARDHPAFRLLRRKASPIMKASTFKRTLTYHAMIHGNGYAAIFRSAERGRPGRELLILDPSETFPAIVNGQLWYVTTVGGQQIRIPGGDVLHIKGLSHDGLVGHSVVNVMAEALGLGIAAREFGARFFGEGSNASGVLMIPGHFDDTKVKNTIAAWEKMASKLKRSHRVALLQDGVKFEKLTIAPEQAQFLETRQFEVREVANILGLPPHKLGDATRTSHSSLEEENQSYLDDGLDCWLNEWEEEATDKLLTEEEREADSHLIEFNRNALLRMKLADRVTAYSKLMEVSAFSANDILRRENMPTIGALGDRRYRPANWMEVTGQSAAIDAAVQNLLTDRVDRLVRIEEEKALQAAEREGNFLAWCESFYESHGNRMTDSLLPAVRMVCAVRGRGDAQAVVGDVVGQYLTAARQQLVECAGRATAATLRAAISECFTGSRMADLVTEILKG